MQHQHIAYKIEVEGLLTMEYMSMKADLAYTVETFSLAFVPFVALMLTWRNDRTLVAQEGREQSQLHDDL